MSSRNHVFNNTYLVNNAIKSDSNKCSKILRFIWKTITCLFSHITLISLVVSYCILGAFTFESLEAEHEKEIKKSIKKIRLNTTEQLWALTTKSLVLRQDNWTLEAIKELRNFERGLLKAITEDGWDGNEDLDTVQWTFSGALFFSIIVITTIGYGHIAPKTHWGKVVTIFYAILGIPMMLLCLSNIGDMMATSFKFIYWRLCCYVCTKKPRKRRHKSNNRRFRKPFRRSVRISQKSTDSGYPTTVLTPSFSDTEFNNKRLSPMKQLIRGGSLDRRKFQNKIPNIEQIKRTPIFCNKYVVKDFDDVYHMYSRRQSTPTIMYTETGDKHSKSVEKHNKQYLSPPSHNVHLKTCTLTENQFVIDEKNGSPKRKKRLNSSYIMSSPRIMSPMGFAVQRRQPRYETDSESENDFGSSEMSAMILNSRSTNKVKPVPIWLCVFLVISYIIGGAFLFKAWENWKFLDSAYFCFITLTTIGFGDFVPAKRVQQNAEVSIALCSLYLLFGISLLAMSFNLVQEEVIANVKSVARRLGIIKTVRDGESSDSSSGNKDESDIY